MAAIARVYSTLGCSASPHLSRLALLGTSKCFGAPKLLLGRALSPSVMSTSASLMQQNRGMVGGQPEDFWVKNARLQRPISPHLTIYEFQITNVLSITHRFTGVGMSLAMTSFAIGLLAMPGNFPSYVEWLCSLHMSSALVTGTKFLIAWPFTYHVCNGVRHLAWDLGLGFSMKTLYVTGYAVVAGSLVAALGLALM